MAKARNPVTVGGHFKIDEKRLKMLDVLDATLGIDTKLFIDPLLLEHSSHSEFSNDGVQQYRRHFEKIIHLLENSHTLNDPAWKAAYRLFHYPEIAGTCLGYGAGSIHGSAWGPRLRTRVLGVAKEIVEIGVRDPDLFSALALFESDIGPDRISDMTTNIIFAALSSFNARILNELGLEGERFEYVGIDARFLINPYEEKRTPIILVPTDILRDLPVAHDWDGVAAAARCNEELRDRVNRHLAEIWARKTKRDKSRLKSEALRTKASFETLLKVVKSVAARPYDVSTDPEGLILWATRGQRYARQYPLSLKRQRLVTLNYVFDIVLTIVAQFRHLVENQGLNKELYGVNKQPRHESTAQRLFFAVAYSYCKANNIDVSPEIDTGNGQIDFKFSTGFDKRVLVEIKLSTNPNVLPGYKNQLEVYKAAEETMKAIYLVIDVGRMGRKEKDLTQLRNAAERSGQPLSQLEFVDGLLKPSASKRR
jgi:hypothetical protein